MKHKRCRTKALRSVGPSRCRGALQTLARLPSGAAVVQISEGSSTPLCCEVESESCDLSTSNWFWRW